MYRPILVLGLLCLAAGSSAHAQDWPHWRGPNYDGSTTAKDLPTDFDKEKHVKWTAPMPGPGAGTPVILGDRVFLPSINEAGGQLMAICLDRRTGKVAWQHEAGSGYRPGDMGSETVLHDRSNYASPSAVADSERVVFFYGNGDLVAYDHAGKELWRRNLQKDYGDFAFQWTFSASPTIWDGLIFLPVLQRDTPVRGIGKDGSPSFLLALDPVSGKSVYKHVRSSDAVKESLESYATPIPHVGADGRKALLIVGGDVITGHDPKTGDELWRWGTWNTDHREEWWRVVPSAVVGEGVALVCAPKRAPVFAVHLDKTGDLGEAGLAWQSEGRRNPVSSDVPTPLFYEGRFFVLSDVAEALSRVVPETGEVEWTIEMPGKHRWRASPTGADGKIWCVNHAGEVVIVDAEEGAIVNRIAMGEEDDDHIRSSLAVAHGDLFVRTNSALFCIGR